MNYCERWNEYGSLSGCAADALTNVVEGVYVLIVLGSIAFRAIHRSRKKISSVEAKYVVLPPEVASIASSSHGQLSPAASSVALYDHIPRYVAPTRAQWLLMVLGAAIGMSRGVAFLVLYLTDQIDGCDTFELVDICVSFGTWIVVTGVLYHLTVNAQPLGTILKSWWLVAFLCSAVRCYHTIRSYMRDGGGLQEFHMVFDVTHVGICLLVLFCGTCFNWETPQVVTMEDDDQTFPAGDVKRRSGDTRLRKACPEDSAGLLSSLTFWWMNTIMIRGYDRPLTKSDLIPPRACDRPRRLYDLFQRQWLADGGGGSDNPETAGTCQASLSRVLRKAFGAMFWEAAVLKFLYDTITFSGPLLLFQITRFLEGDQDSVYGWLFVAALFGSGVVNTLILHQYFHRMFRFGMRIRATLIVAVYSKAMRLSQFARNRYSIGEIVTLMSADAQRLQDVMPFFHVIWSGPYQAALCLYFLYQQVGISMCAGLAAILLMVPVNGLMAKKMQVYQRELMKRKEKRIKFTDEAVKSIKVLKLYAWEYAFGDRIEDLRSLELQELRKYMYYRASMACMWTGLPILVAISTFSTYTLLGNKLTAARAFTALSLFGILRFPLTMFPWVLSKIVEAQVSVKRLEKFLAAHELQKPLPPLTGQNEYTLIGIQGKFYWGPNLEANHPWLEKKPESSQKKGKKSKNSQGSESDSSSSDSKSATMHEESKLEDKSRLFIQNPHMLAIATPGNGSQAVAIERGSFVVVAGRTGAGKSAFIHALTGELEASPDAKRNLPAEGRVALTAQVPWICNATVRENILFGKAYNKKWYARVIYTCALEKDFKALPAGDRTEIGEQGVNLSGGQKQRVALARAVYADVDVYLLDDTLSAVDAHVGRHIFEKCVRGLLLKKTVILVTHHIRYLPQADQVILIENANVIYNGPYSGLVEENKRNISNESNPGIHGDSKTSKISGYLQAILRDATKEELAKSTVETSNQSIDSGGEKEPVEGERATRKESAGKGRMMEEEKRETGQVKWEIYKEYFDAGGGYPIILITTIAIASVTFLEIYKDQWLTVWSHHGEGNTSYYLAVYASMALFTVLLRGIYLAIIYLAGLRASRTLHSSLRSAIMRAPIWFHDTTSGGSILNRFSSDLETIDEVLVNTMSNYVSVLFRVIGTVATIAYVTPLFLAALAPIGLLYWKF
ncbi:hypothetical protein AAMO2058_000578200 [Amorphochlora amoebiformis]